MKKKAPTSNLPATSEQPVVLGKKPTNQAFKICVVDENGIKSGDFSDIKHLKFETAKHNGTTLLPTSKEQQKLL